MTRIERLREKAVGVLRWSERYTRTDMVYLAKGGGWLAIGQLISTLSAFLLSIAFANFFPKEAYGEYRYIFSIIGIAGAFSLTGMDTALSRAVARGFDGTFKESMRMMLVWSLGTSAVLVAGAIYYFINDNTTLGWGLITAALATPFLKTFNLYGSFLVGKKDFGRRIRYGVFYDVVPTIALACALSVTDSALIIIGTYFLSYTVISFVLNRLTRTIYSGSIAVDEEARAYSFHLSAMNAVGAVSFQLDKILTFHYLGAAQLAIYSFSVAMPQQIRQLQKHVATLVFPKFSEQPFNQIRKHIAAKALRMFIVVSVIVLVYITVAPFIFRLFFPHYLDSIIYSQLYALVLLTSPIVLFKQALTAHKKTRELYMVQVVVPLFKIGMLFLIVPRYGILGTVLVILGAEVLNLMMTMFFLYRMDAASENRQQ
jgi:O-antigen/teichoic acid export membrane protein